jgi:hypothetical protein
VFCVLLQKLVAVLSLVFGSTCIQAVSLQYSATAACHLCMYMQNLLELASNSLGMAPEYGSREVSTIALMLT